MIITKLQGGLGNQLFQYAAGLALAQKHGVTLKADTSFLKLDPKGHYTKREPELHHFELQLEEANESDLKKFNLNESILWRKLKKQFPTWFNSIVFNESQQQVEPNFFKLPANVYLNGYWQSEKYFSEIRDLLIQRLSIKPEYLQNTEPYLSLIKKTTETVALHIRRGDYVSLSSAKEFHGVCGVEYYQKAATMFSEKAQLLVFSDDLDWCRANLRFKQPTELINTGSTYSDFYLMKNCQHQIIANSSFSWWAAWLNTNPSKKVIAPKKWFADSNINTSDVYPVSWEKI